MLVLFETILLLLLLRALGELRQQGKLTSSASRQVVSIGDQAPDFTASDSDGNTLRLEDLCGRPVLLAFVSPSCPACAGTIDAFNTLLQEKPEMSQLIVGGPNMRQNRDYALEHQARMPLWTAPPRVPLELYGIPGVPFVFVLDDDLIVRAGGTVNEYAHLTAVVKTAFGSTAISA